MLRSLLATAGSAPVAVESCADLRLGLPVILRDGRDSWLVALVETLREARYRAMATLGDTLRIPVPAGSGFRWLVALAGQAGRSPEGASEGLLSAGTEQNAYCLAPQAAQTGPLS